MYFSIHPDCSDSATVVILYLGYGYLSRFKIKSAFARDCLEREFALRASLTKALLFLKEYLWRRGRRGMLFLCASPLLLATAVGAYCPLCGFFFSAIEAGDCHACGVVCLPLGDGGRSGAQPMTHSVVVYHPWGGGGEGGVVGVTTPGVGDGRGEATIVTPRGRGGGDTIPRGGVEVCPPPQLRVTTGGVGVGYSPPPEGTSAVGIL